ncbi:MAG: hypothetical protein AAGB06_02465 [Verrucomicrobiota bacterium]
MNKKRTQIAGITIVFASIYFGLRNMPNSQCDFLHYEVTEILADGTEVCSATNHAGWIDLSKVRYPLSMEIDSGESESIRPGTPATIHLKFETDGGQNIYPHDLAITHTERMHVMIIDPSLNDYHHVHPIADGASTAFTFEFTPQEAGEYRVFAEMVPVRTKRQVVALGSIQVSGPADPPQTAPRFQSQVGDFVFNLNSETLRRGRDVPVGISIERADGSDIDLQLVMGAYGHMVAFDTERNGYKHMHPVEFPFASPEADGQLQFLVNLPNSGHYRLYAQVRIDGQDIFAPFDIEI